MECTGSVTGSKGAKSAIAAARIAPQSAPPYRQPRVRVRHAVARILGSRCLVVGPPELADRMTRLARKHPGSGLVVVGYVQRPGSAAHAGEGASGCPAVGMLEDLERVVAEHRVDRVVIAPGLPADPGLRRRLRAMSYSGVAISDVVAMHEDVTGEVPLDDVDEQWLFRAATACSRLHVRYLKRVSDVVAAALLLVPASIAIAVAAVAIKLTSRGPVLFRQKRLGLHGAEFQMVKLRTMYQDAEKISGPVWSMAGDPRITRVGRLLRKFRIDELPQLVNVVRGEMSLIGPRPERPVLAEKISRMLPLFSERLLVRPGITGWAQVMAPYAASVDDSRRKLQFDLYYAKNISFLLDMVIAAKTVRTMLLGRERSPSGLTAGHQSDPCADAAGESRAAG